MNATGKRPLVTEDDRRKSLRFDRDDLQSAMYKHAPFDLALSYTRTIMGFLLFQPAPRDILIVGLGGGSLSKYCYRYVPAARVTTVEIDDHIIALRDEFAIPPDNERFRIVHADGADFIEEVPAEGFDAIVLDGYGPDGLPERLSSQSFYDRCANALRDDGVLVANFLESDPRRAIYVSRLRATFDDKVVKIRPERSSNWIACALNCERMPTARELRKSAVELEPRYGINFQSIAARMLSDLEKNPVAI